MKTIRAHAAVRTNADGGEFIIISEIKLLDEQVKQEVEFNARQIPGWHAANPVSRFTVVEIAELTA